MAKTTPAYAAHAAKSPLARTTIERREVGEFDVLIDIKYAGICHSDIRQVNEGWGPRTFPMVPRHEIAGIVSAVGAGVGTDSTILRRTVQRWIEGQRLNIEHGRRSLLLMIISSGPPGCGYNGGLFVRCVLAGLRRALALVLSVSGAPVDAHRRGARSGLHGVITSKSHGTAGPLSLSGGC
jgi:hypothetical protein